MIMLASECLWFKNAGDDLIPCAAELVSVELVGGSNLVDQEIINNAAVSVLHYFKVELCRDTVTLGEFSEALERVLKKFGVAIHSKLKSAPSTPAPAALADNSLAALAEEVGYAGELAFFPRLRSVVRLQLEQATTRLSFSELRQCVKQLTGARRWCPRCQNLGDDIVEFLRDCLTNDLHGRPCALVVR
jgi:hypothetical protein